MTHQLISLLDRIALHQEKPVGTDPVKKLYDFRISKQEHQQRASIGAITELQQLLWELAPNVFKNPGQAMLLVDALSLSYQLNDAAPDQLADILAQLRKLAPKLPVNEQRAVSFTLPALPIEIRSEIHADAEELEKCLAASAYRSCVVLCGRILETALHRKYFDATSQDILEKNPGIGLGNLIAKMKEKGISLDPALANQIHLINQVRIFSVHKKQEAFAPSKPQAQAIMLYTMDAVKQLFSR